MITRDNVKEVARTRALQWLAGATPRMLALFAIGDEEAHAHCYMDFGPAGGTLDTGLEDEYAAAYFEAVRS